MIIMAAIYSEIQGDPEWWDAVAEEPEPDWPPASIPTIPHEDLIFVPLPELSEAELDQLWERHLQVTGRT